MEKYFCRFGFCLVIALSVGFSCPPQSPDIQVVNKEGANSDVQTLKALSDSTAQAFRQTDMVRTQEYAEQGIALARRLNDLAQMAQL
ncbi:MAG: hypothetical protein LBR50_06275, partial [Tannerella sp.]|nr:hypothetical protein [Tannerella sp.]